MRSPTPLLNGLRTSVRPTAVLRALLLLGLVLGLSPLDTRAGAVEVTPSSGVWPLSPRPRIIAGFDPPATQWSAGHRGVDLAGQPGQQVRAALAGRVAFTGRIAGRGVLVVDHGARRTTYEPVSATVQVGDRVAAGTPIGRLELFGSHCFPSWCLHWGLIEGRDHYLDPLTLVGAAPVVLLPLYSSPWGLGVAMETVMNAPRVALRPAPAGARPEASVVARPGRARRADERDERPAIPIAGRSWARALRHADEPGGRPAVGGRS